MGVGGGEGKRGDGEEMEGGGMDCCIDSDGGGNLWIRARQLLDVSSMGRNGYWILDMYRGH